MNDLNLTPDQIGAFKIQLQKTIDSENAAFDKAREFERKKLEATNLKNKRAHRFIFIVLLVGAINLVLNSYGVYSTDKLKDSVAVNSRKITLTNVRLKAVVKTVKDAITTADVQSDVPQLKDATVNLWMPKRTQKPCTYTLVTDAETHRFSLKSVCE